jgi:valyl-tRNA synthetase
MSEVHSPSTPELSAAHSPAIADGAAVQPEAAQLEGAQFELAKAYDPAATETHWYSTWEKAGYFRASDAPEDQRPTYTIAIPPPNVTGVLHMGHACRVTFEDVLIRYHRMCGYNTLWIPGTDHAGIATQVVVERRLKAQGTTKEALGRERFVERVWEWKAESGGNILRQLRILGASCDWSREHFTLDADLSRAVTTVFLRLHNEGLIYRATRLTNWCVRCRTALSDLEVVSEEGANGELFDFAYPVEGGGEIVVSTTRPETMLGDTAIAVHPDDPRYVNLHGKYALHPFTARRIPIITDAVLVDPAFGTGAVKVTPAHDHNDFATGKRHGLEELSVLERDGTLNEAGGPFRGMPRFEARKAVKAALEERGLVRGTRAHTLTIPRCDRCNEVVEPLITTQWYVRMEPLAKPAIAAVEQGRTQIVPEHWTKTYYHWMHNIQDWCISRQLWWGHPVPAYHCAACGKFDVAEAQPATCSHCGAASPTPDPDVLDTWFSSALWPFSTLGWPDATLDLKRFYPTQDMETGYDILFFWVARMMMMGLHFMGDVPFRRVLLAGMVTDEAGKKMSKVKGNTLDPLDIIRGATLEQLLDKAKYGGAAEAGLKYIQKTYPEGIAACGADALRFTLLSYSPQTTKIALSLKRIEGNRNFCNKLWNAARYVLRGLGERPPVAARPTPTELPNVWILSRLAAAITTARQGIDEYRLDEASAALYRFVWDEFCDWYLELSKPLLACGDARIVEETSATLLHSLETVLRALHPMIPFITEEIWQRLPKPASAAPSVMLAAYPVAHVDGALNERADAEMAALQEVIVSARTIRAEYSIAKQTLLPLSLLSNDAELRELFVRQTPAIASLCGAAVTVEEGDGQDRAQGNALRIAGRATVLVALAGLVDRTQELGKIQKELAKTEKDLKVVQGRLASATFVERAPPEIVQKERERLAELQSALAQLKASAAELN